MPQEKEEIEQAYRSLLCLPILSPAHISASERTLAWNPNPPWELGGVGKKVEGEVARRYGWICSVNETACTVYRTNCRRNAETDTTVRVQVPN
jgi:hypothetical protein